MQAGESNVTYGRYFVYPLLYSIRDKLGIIRQPLHCFVFDISGPDVATLPSRTSLKWSRDFSFASIQFSLSQRFKPQISLVGGKDVCVLIFSFPLLIMSIPVEAIIGNVGSKMLRHVLDSSSLISIAANQVSHVHRSGLMIFLQ